MTTFAIKQSWNRYRTAGWGCSEPTIMSPRALVSRRRMLQSGAAFALGAVAPGELAAAETNASLVDGTFLAVGDWGRGNATQLQVAAGMARIAEEKPIGFVISTGDNFYKGGVKSTDDRLWKQLFEDVYS